jgi:hypothetical protein
MFYIIFLLLIGISFSPFVFPKLHFYLAQGAWSQCCIGLMFFWSLIENPKRRINNCPISLLFLWITGVSAFICYSTQAKNSHNFFYILQYFNFLSVIIFYKIAHEYLTCDNVVTIFKWMKYVVLVTLFFAVLQIFDLSQFFTLVTKNDPFHNNTVTGFIGNGTHFSGFLAICLPLFLYEGKRQDWLSIILLLLVLFFCGTNKQDIALTGFVVSIIVLLNFYKTNKKLLFFVPFLGLLFLISYPENFFGLNGRFETWQQILVFFKQLPVTGQGLGATYVLAKSGFVNSPHIHQEFLQYLFELGIVGFILIIYLIKDCFDRTATSVLQLSLKSCLLSFLLVCCFLFPTHLWLESMWGMFFYVAFLIVHREESKWQAEKKLDKKL